VSYGNIERGKVELAVAARIDAWVISFVAMGADHGLFHREGVGAFKIKFRCFRVRRICAPVKRFMMTDSRDSPENSDTFREIRVFKRSKHLGCEGTFACLIMNGGRR
jgi:hypothetical protein